MQLIANSTNLTNSCHVLIFTIGVGEVHCGLYPVTFEAGSVNASVMIPILNDEIAECDEKFTADIVIGEGGRGGFRPGPMSSVPLTVMDDDSKFVYLLHYVVSAFYCMYSLIFPLYINFNLPVLYIES